MLSRPDVINKLLSQFANPRYLEIGVWRGDTFSQCNFTHETAVDPVFAFDVEAAKQANPNSNYVAQESDQYFCQLSRDVKFDVIFIDGMHTFEQSLTDLQNSIHHLAPKGYIVLDDVIPNDYAASFPDRNKSKQYRSIVGELGDSWMGNVFKTIFFVSAFMPAYSYATALENHGQALLWREARPSWPAKTRLASITSMQFADAMIQSEIWQLKPLDEIIKISAKRS